MRAGPSGSREFRTAMPEPSGSSATSTQLPLGLLRRLFRQASPGRSLADDLTATSLMCVSLCLRRVRVLCRAVNPSSARASALAPACDAEDDIAQAVRISQPNSWSMTTYEALKVALHPDG